MPEIVPDRDNSAVAPDFFIVGAPKCGTTSLHYYLQQHPELCLSNASEPGYYLKDCDQVGLDRYLAQYFYHRRAHQRLGEATTGYARCTAALERIHRDRPDAKIIMLVRPHADALRSWYWHEARSQKPAGPIEQLLSEELAAAKSDGVYGHYHGYFAVFQYQQQLETCCRLFGDERVAVWSTGDLARKTTSVLSAVCNHLGVGNFDWAHADLRPQNTAASVSAWKASVKRRLVRAVRKVPGSRCLPQTIRTRIHQRLDRLTQKPLVAPPLSADLHSAITAYFAADASYLRERWGIDVNA